MKKIFTLILAFVGAFALLAQNPYVNAAGTGLANSFDTEADVLNDYVGVGWQFNEIGTEGDTAMISWVDGAMKIEAKYDWDYAMAKFLISPDLMETIDISNKIHISFKYKNLTPADIALVASFRNNTGDGELLYGGEIWLEGTDLVYGSDDWNTIDMDFAIEDVNINKVALLEIGFDGIGNGSVLIDDVVFGDYTVSANPYVNAAMTGLANSFDSEEDVMNEFVAVGWQFNEIGTEGDTATISWVDGAMKIEAKYEWDYAMAKFLISPDLMETIDISNNIHITFKYKNLMPADIALVASFRNNTGDGELLYGGEVWLEGADLVYGSDEWNTIDMDFAIEDVNINKVALLEIGFDGIANGSVLIDDVVFGDIVVSAEEIDASHSGIQVYPNPANHYLRISNAGRVFDVAIYNTVGQHMLSVQNQEQIDIGSLDAGLYFIRVSSKDVSDTFKVIVR
jgi:uncharacterized protein YciU (UPF0263 family)